MNIPADTASALARVADEPSRRYQIDVQLFHLGVNVPGLVIINDVVVFVMLMTVLLCFRTRL